MSRDPAPGFAFDYDRAFSRNIGWVTRDEQQRLRRARVAVAGLGGVGGLHVLALSRLGVANFNIADFDEFDVHNMNRQAAAFMSTMGRPKLDVVAEMARDINPESDIRRFPQVVTDANLDEFLKDVDVYVDSLDFFVLEASEYTEQLDGALARSAGNAPDLDLFTRNARALRGSATMARVDGIAAGNSTMPSDATGDGVQTRFLRADQITVADPLVSAANWRRVRSIRIGLVLRSAPNSAVGSVAPRCSAVTAFSTSSASPAAIDRPHQVSSAMPRGSSVGWFGCSRTDSRPGDRKSVV